MEKLSELLCDLRYNEALEQGLALVRGGAVSEFQDEIVAGLRLVETRYNAGELFIADLIVAGALIRDIFALARESALMGNAAVSGTVVIGTISGDIHSIGKDIFADALRYRGVTVIDLGVDVPIEDFLRAAALHRPDILAISSCIDTSFANAKALVNRLRRSAETRGMKIILGGSVVDERFTKIPGVDLISRDFQTGITFCVEILQEKEKKT